MNLLVKKLLPFILLLLVILGCGRTKEEQLKYEERQKVVETLNKKFDLHNPLYKAATGRDFDCKFQFRTDYGEDKTLIVRFCESTSEYTKEQRLAEVLTSENMALIKNSGFTRVNLYDRSESKLVDSKTIQ